MFSPVVQERLRSYVYLLSDPRDNHVFYVGKGVGNRIFDHARAALQVDEQRPSDKLDLIREIQNAGLSVRYQLLRSGLTDKVAFEVEAAAIQLFKLDDLAHLLNLVSGHDAERRGLMSTDDAISLLDAPPVGEITEAVLLIKIPQLWYPSMPPEALLEATAGWWDISIRREKARYAFAVSKGVIREVYEIHLWRQRQPGDRDSEDDIGKPRKRWGFSGAVAPNLAHYRNHSVRHLYKRGDRSEIKFIHC
jgi:uncharacterized protein